eukprot:Pgem_evm1s16173
MSEFKDNSNSWTSLPNMSTARYAFAAATFADGKIGVFGGYDDNKRLNTAIVYNPKDNSWESLANMPTARYGCAAATFADGTIG